MLAGIMPVLADMDIDLAGIRYFAGTTMRSNVLDLGRRVDADRYLHAIAFIAHQHHRLQDVLVDMLINASSTFENSVKREHKDQVFAQRQSVNNRLETVLHAINKNALDPLRQIRCVVEDDTLADAMKLDRIGTILEQGHEDAIDRLQKEIRESSSDDMQYRKILEVKSQRLQNRINPMLRQIAFTGDGLTVDLLAALAYFREKDGKLNPKMPLDFLTPDERKAVLNILLAIRCMRVNWSSRFQPIHWSRGRHLKAPDCQPARPTHWPRQSKTYRTPRPAKRLKPR